MNLLSTNVKTPSDLMSIALQTEREAIRRYTQLAAAMRDGHNQSAAELFERMVAEEREHESLLLAWMAEEGIKESSEIPAIRWHDPNIPTTYNEEARDPYQSSPYRALAFAVHNEEIAFRFYTHVAAHSENSKVREYAEELAREELGHAALLRAERRRAYHAEREANVLEPRLKPKLVRNEADLLAVSIHFDSVLLGEVSKIAEQSPEIKVLAGEIQSHINTNEKALQQHAVNKQQPGETMVRNIAEFKAYNDTAAEHAMTQEQRVQSLNASCDRSFSFYDAVVANTADEAVMLAAQNLSSSALDRIGVLKQVMSNEANSNDI